MSTDNHPIEIAPPDIARFRHGNAGVDYVHVFDSGRAGPTVMVQALTHGNEFCGALAAFELLDARPVPARGRLVVAFANVEAFARFDFDDPDRSRYIDEDYNRVWADEVLFGPRDSAELRRARQLQPFVDAADFLLDLHSMHEPCRPIMVCGVGGRGGDKAVALSRQLGVPGHLLLDTGHPAGLRMIERGAFGDPASERTALLIECGQHWERSAVEVARDTLRRFLVTTGVIDAAAAHRDPRSPDDGGQRVIRVTEPVVAESMAFRFAADFRGLEVIAQAGTPIAFDGERIWSAPYDDTVLVMPSLRHLKPGTTMVRLGRIDPPAS
jgi:predicted deacylase